MTASQGSALSCAGDSEGGTLRNKLVAEQELQHAVTTEWSTSKKTVLDADKCEVTLFSTISHEANWQPTVIAINTRLHHNPQPKFLGVTLDRLLTFGPHIQSDSKKDAKYPPPSPRRSGCGERTS